MTFSPDLMIAQFAYLRIWGYLKHFSDSPSSLSQKLDN